MGLRVSIYRSDYDCDRNVFFGKKSVTLVNVDGPSEPTVDAPAARLVQGYGKTAIIVPMDDYLDGVQVMGGTYAGSSDSRFHRAVENLSGNSHFAVAVHDRRETWEMHDALSR